MEEEKWIHIVQCIDDETGEKKNEYVMNFFHGHTSLDNKMYPKYLVGVHRLKRKTNNVYLRRKKPVSNKEVVECLKTHLTNLDNPKFKKTIPNCFCGYPASVKVSKTRKNRGKVFYSCCISQKSTFYGHNIVDNEKCSFLEWTFQFT